MDEASSNIDFNWADLAQASPNKNSQEGGQKENNSMGQINWVQKYLNSISLANQFSQLLPVDD